MSKYIDADKLLILLDSFIDSRTTVTTPEPYIAGLQRAEKIIKIQPIADVQEVKHGTFKGEEGTAIFSYCKCSHCNEYTPMGYYCYYCGAKMDGGTE